MFNLRSHLLWIVTPLTLIVTMGAGIASATAEKAAGFANPAALFYDWRVREFTETELRQFDGSGGRPVYIAYKGKVYDVTASRYWRTGMHQEMHYAGLDLTRSLRKAPHKEEVFARFVVVGTLRQDDDA